MRAKYRSAVYHFNIDQEALLPELLKQYQADFKDKVITKSLPFNAFKPSPPAYQNYYENGPDKPFCNTYINPKLTKLMSDFSTHLDVKKMPRT